MVKVKVAQSCLTLRNPMDYTVYAILQARILEWVKPIPSPADLPDPCIEPGSPSLQADSLQTELSGKPKKKITKFIRWVGLPNTTSSLIKAMNRNDSVSPWNY